MKKNRKIASVFLIAVFACGFVSAFDLINPVPGEWANKQPLVIELSPGEEVFYSIAGTDPLASGFAYDKPVLLDVDGDVNLRIAVVQPNGIRKNISVRYTVKKTFSPSDAVAKDFISGIEQNPLVAYVAGDELAIPPTLSYCFGSIPADWMIGQSLAMNPMVAVSRYIPCMVTDENEQSIWRFVINSRPYIAGSFSHRVVPFEISDWSTLTCVDDKYIYRIDDGFWARYKQPIEINRSEPHVISWQSISYQRGNPIQTFVLPARPEISVERAKNGVATVTAGGEGFRIAAADYNGEATEMFEAISIDAFAGEHIAGVMSVAVYYNSVYQGHEDIAFNIDRKPPKPPVITSDTTVSLARSAVNVSVAAERDAYVCVAAISQKASAGEIDAPSQAAFTEVPFSTANISLAPEENSVLYTVRAYAVDGAGNKSSVVTYSVTIDANNFYVSEFADPKIADGSAERPYADLAACLEAASGSTLPHIFVEGTVKVPDGSYIEFLRDCIIDGVSDDAHLIFYGDGIKVRNAGLTINNCVLSFQQGKNDTHFILLEDALLSVVSSEISGVAGQNGVLIDADSSIISLIDSGLTVTASNYASSLSAVDSEISMRQTRVSASASTSVAMSVHQGKGSFSGSSFYVTGNIGRVAEFFASNISLSNNIYAPSLPGYDGTSLIFADAKSVVSDDKTSRVLTR